MPVLTRQALLQTAEKFAAPGFAYDAPVFVGIADVNADPEVVLHGLSGRWIIYVTEMIQWETVASAVAAGTLSVEAKIGHKAEGDKGHPVIVYSNEAGRKDMLARIRDLGLTSVAYWKFDSDTQARRHGIESIQAISPAGTNQVVINPYYRG